MFDILRAKGFDVYENGAFHGDIECHYALGNEVSILFLTEDNRIKLLSGQYGEGDGWTDYSAAGLKEYEKLLNDLLMKRAQDVKKVVCLSRGGVIQNIYSYDGDIKVEIIDLDEEDTTGQEIERSIKGLKSIY